MSGPKQHYIPQSLLRGFGRPAKRKIIQVAVYTKNQGVFVTATEGVAAQRFFYSGRPPDTSSKTLDDRITAFESQLAKTFEEIRSANIGSPVDAEKAAEAVAHMCTRQAHLRVSFASAVGQLFDGASEVFLDKDRARKALGLDDTLTNEIVQDEIHKLFEASAPHLKALGISKSQFEQWAVSKAKADFDRNFAEQLPRFREFFTQLKGRTDKIARDGHNRALERGLVPDARFEVLRRYVWKVDSGPINGLLLPDCVAIGFSADEGYLPLTYFEKDKSRLIFMPISHNKLLVGTRDGAEGIVPELLNEIFVTCCWEFFVARDHTSEFELLISKIGKQAYQFINQTIEVAFESYQ